MNLIITGLPESSARLEELRNRNCAVEVLPGDRLLGLLKNNADPSLIADAIICFADAGTTDFEPLAAHSLRIEVAQKLAQDIRRLPDSCAMQDGRKWKAIPIVIVLLGEEALLAGDELRMLGFSEAVVFVEALQDFKPTFRVIDDAVREYRQRILQKLDTWAS